MKAPKRPVALMALGQIICGLTVPLTLFVPAVNTTLLICYTMQADFAAHDNTLTLVLFSMLMCLRDFAAAGCIVAAEAEACRLCGRMKRSTAFSPANVKSLGRMVVCLGIAGAITLLLGNSIMDFLLTGLPPVSPWLIRLLPPFTLLTIALMLRAVQLLMRRALDMQDENQLTV